MKWWKNLLNRVRWSPPLIVQESSPPIREHMPELHDLRNESLKEQLRTELLSRQLTAVKSARQERLEAQTDLFNRDSIHGK